MNMTESSFKKEHGKETNEYPVIFWNGLYKNERESFF